MLDSVNPIRLRRSTYPAQFSNESIADEIIWEVLKDANNAPSHRNTEPWQFIVFADEAKNTFGEKLAKAYKSDTDPEQYSQLKFDKTIKKAIQTSHIIAIIMRRSVDNLVPEWEEIAATACAVENIYISCAMRNLACYWSTPKAICKNPSFLNLKENERCLGVLYLGNPGKNLSPQKEKADIKAKTSWVNSITVDSQFVF